MEKITILHCSETLSVSGCCRVMEHLAKGANSERFKSLFYAEKGDAKYLDYLLEQNISASLDFPKLEKPFVAVFHRSGNDTPFWEKLISQLKVAGVSAIIERNIFGYPDAHHDQDLKQICANSMNTLWHHWRQSGKPSISEYMKRHRVLYNAVGFAPSQEELKTLRTEWRNKLGITEEDFVIGIVTRPDPHKIDALIVGLIPRLKKTIPNVVLVTRCYPERLAKPLRLMLGKNYHNLPVASDQESLKATYAMMDVCANFPSIGESFGMAMAEAMRAYKPVIALDQCQENKGNSQRELIESGRTGFVATSPMQIAQAFKKLAKDKSLRGQMGAAAHRKMTSAPFAMESVIAQFESEVLHALGEPRSVPLEPDEATIAEYLKTYPQQEKSNKMEFSFPVFAVRLGWKIMRRFL